MRGIPEERLRELIENDDYYDSGIEKSVIYGLIANECQELNPWLPIDENTPMNRYLLCVNSVGRKDVLRLDGHSNTWRTQDGLAAHYLPTHYQELPDDPELGDKNG